MRFASWAFVLSSAAAVASAGCGRNGPLPPWPTFDLAGPATSGDGDLAVTTPHDLGAPPDLAPRPVRTWQWVNPGTTGNPLRAVGGTSASDLWLAGDLGTILHWDGTRASVAHTSAPLDSYFAVAASAPDDVWIAGRSSSGSILHWDGTLWSSAYAIATQPIHALAGGPLGIYAASDDGNGKGRLWSYTPAYGWSLSDAVITPSIARDVLALPSTDVALFDALFVVGDKGTVAWGEGYSWVAGGASDPFTADKNYFGVWGTTASDVWAAFTSGSTLGFTHFDGQTWTVAQTLAPQCLVYEPPDPPFDQGKRLVGLDANHILASVEGPTSHCGLYEWNGTTWTSRAGAQPYQPSFAGVADRWYAVGPNGLLEVSNSDATWTTLPYPARNDLLEHVAVSDDSIWSTITVGSVSQALQPLSWSPSGWQVSSTPSVSDGSEPIDLWALAANDVWLAGSRVDTHVEGMVMHWDGSAWTMPTILPNSHYLTGIWADRDDDVWAVGRGDPGDDYGDSAVVYHFDGKSWSSIPVPPHPARVEMPAVFGLDPNDVWITALVSGVDQRFVWKWDGSSLQQVAWMPNDNWRPAGRPWAAGVDDVWIPGHPVLHWDGQTWSSVGSPSPDFLINAIYGTSRDDVWGVGTGPFGGAIWHWENGEFVSALDLSAPLYNIAGSKHMLPWAVGDVGATLRLVEQAPGP